MGLNPTDTHSPYAGMATSIPAADLPKNLCQSAIGFVPGRNGKLELAPLIKRLTESLGITIYGTAVWQSEAGIGDRLLLFSSTTVYSLLLTFSSGVSTIVWKQDERADGPHAYYDLGSLTTVATHGQSAAIGNGVYSIQYAGTSELIISIGGVLFRYYVASDGTGAEKWYQLGMSTPGAPTLAQTTGGSLTSGQTYYYEFTWEDELGRESSPSAATSITLSSSNNRVTVTQGTGGGTVGTYGGTYWNIYRLNPGQTSYRFVAQVALGTTTYNDDFADSVINARAAAPDDGENDPPFSSDATPGVAGQANIFAIWKNRLVINSVNDPNRVQVSNAGSPVQFSSLPLPTNLDDGLQISVGGHGQNIVTGLANLGSLLCVFGRETTSLLYGDDISDFTLRETLQRGCQNPNSIQRCENEVLFLSNDNIYAIGYESGYAVDNRSIVIENQFRGFQWAKSDNPVSVWRYNAAQVQNAINTNVNSFYMDNRYFLSVYNRTLCLDIRTGGWTDTGWGFIKTVSRYNSQVNAALTGLLSAGVLPSAPETIFLTFGDPTTWATYLNYFTSSDTPDDRDAPSGYQITAQLVMRPVGAEENTEVRSKRVVWLSQMGTSSAKKGDVIGTLTWNVDGKAFNPRPIYAGIVSNRTTSLFEMSGPPASGETTFCVLDFQGVRQLSLENSLFDLVYLN